MERALREKVDKKFRCAIVFCVLLYCIRCYKKKASGNTGTNFENFERERLKKVVVRISPTESFVIRVKKISSLCRCKVSLKYPPMGSPNSSAAKMNVYKTIVSFTANFIAQFIL